MKFPPDYRQSRAGFLRAGARLGWAIETYPISARGPQGEELALDVALSPDDGSRGAVVASCALHGSEGPFGAAILLAALEAWQAQPPPKGVRVVLWHALNPFGYAWGRRANEDNVDLNRNFLMPGEDYRGCPDGYRWIEGMLNPPRPPRWWDPFPLRAAWAVLRHGMPALKQAIAEGQYDFPKGIFFGGHRPAAIVSILAQHLDRWLALAPHVLQLDFHSGLGVSRQYKLLLEHPLSDEQQRWLSRSFGADALEDSHSAGVAFHTRGSLGRWCETFAAKREYVYLCAEFGTYPLMRVLNGLRNENMAHHWAAPDDPRTRRAKAQMRELFNPASPRWRECVLRRGLALIRAAAEAVTRR